MYINIIIIMVFCALLLYGRNKFFFSAIQTQISSCTYFNLKKNIQIDWTKLGRIHLIK